MYRLLFSLILVVMVGCQTTQPQPVVHLENSSTSDGNKEEYYGAPVIFDDISTPVIFEQAPGASVVEIEVPASPVPTKIYVKKKHKSIRQTLLPFSEEAGYEAISTNKDVVMKQEKITPWWWLAIIVIVGGLIAWEALSRIFDTLLGPVKMLLGLFRR